MTALSDARLREPQPSDGAGTPRRHVIVAGSVIVGLGALFFFSYSRSDLWLDEALSVNIARLPLGDLRAALEHDGAPPLYYVLLHVWTAVFGTGAVAARSLSAVCMAGAVVTTWFAGRRFGGPTLAWLAAAVMATSPFTIRYATEARMYALLTLLVASGVVAVQRTVERPTWGRAAVFGVVVALAVYTQYWSFYVLPTLAALFAWMIWRGHDRVAGIRLLVAGAVGLLTFLPWLPTFLSQRAHTGTPWGTPLLPSIPFAYTLRDFAGGAAGTQADRQEGWLLFFVVISMLLLGVFARGVDRRHIEIDVRTQVAARPYAFVAFVGLAVALSLNYLAGGAFQSRYAVIVFPLFVLLVARGFTTLRDNLVLVGVLAVAIALGFAGGVRNLTTQRTQAGEVAAVLRAEAKPGDVVVYCPDQVGPAVHRRAPAGLDEVVFPSFAGPAFVDWVDYKDRLAAADVNAFARDALTRAEGRTLWYVSAPGYKTHTGTCEALSDAFAAARPRLQRTISDEQTFEKPALQEFRVASG